MSIDIDEPEFDELTAPIACQTLVNVCAASAPSSGAPIKEVIIRISTGSAKLTPAVI